MILIKANWVTVANSKEEKPFLGLNVNGTLYWGLPENLTIKSAFNMLKLNKVACTINWLETRWSSSGKIACRFLWTCGWDLDVGYEWWLVLIMFVVTLDVSLTARNIMLVIFNCCVSLLRLWFRSYLVFCDSLISYFYLFIFFLVFSACFIFPKVLPIMCQPTCHAAAFISHKKITISMLFVCSKSRESQGSCAIWMDCWGFRDWPCIGGIKHSCLCFLEVIKLLCWSPKEWHKRSR